MGRAMGYTMGKAPVCQVHYTRVTPPEEGDTGKRDGANHPIASLPRRNKKKPNRALLSTLLLCEPDSVCNSEFKEAELYAAGPYTFTSSLLV